MAQPLMPKATAVWLVENTALGFDQIAAFCGMHELEIQAIADGEVAIGMVGMDPLANGQLTQEEIDRCQADPSARLKLAKHDMPQPVARSKGPRYTPVTKRADKPDGTAWLIKNHPELSDAQIGKLIGTTKPTINAIRDRTHWNSPNIKARNPMLLGLFTYNDLNEALEKAHKRLRADGKEIPKPDPDSEVALAQAAAEAREAEANKAAHAEPDIASVFGTAPSAPVDLPPVDVPDDDGQQY